jgi:hypothetical protein
MIHKTKVRSGRQIGAIVAGVAACMAMSAAVSAMPIETESYSDIPGATEDGQLDIREVLDNSTEMDIRLTKQIMLLQRQINLLERKIKKLETAEAE